MLRRWTTRTAVTVVAISLTLAFAVPADAATDRYAQAQGITADVTYKLTSLHVAFGPEPSASIGPGGATDIQGVVNLNVPAGFGSFEADNMLGTASTSVSTHAESSIVVSGFNFLDFRGDQLVTECEATASGATGTTTLTNVLADGGQPLADNPAPNTVVDFSPDFIVHLNEQHVTTTATGTRIEVIGMRVVYGLAGDYSGEFSVGRSVCQFGAVGFGGGAPDDGAPDPDQTAVVADPTFTG